MLFWLSALIRSLLNGQGVLVRTGPDLHYFEPAARAREITYMESDHHTVTDTGLKESTYSRTIPSDGLVHHYHC